MSSGNRTVKYENLLKSLRKHYKPLSDPPERTVLEHLLYACCLEDARVEQADEGFAKLQQTYFDWNEVRVTTAVELAEALKPLPFPMQAASRIKQCLQSIFETRYQYDIDDMKKANLGKATAELEGWKGMSPYVISYVSQHALGGHSIPASHLICEAMWQCDILTIPEIQKKALPGIERAIPKNKGVEFAGLVHQFASDLYHHPKSATPLAVLKDLGATFKSKPKQEEPSTASKSKSGSAKGSDAKPVAATDQASRKGSEATAASTSKPKEEVKQQKAGDNTKASGVATGSGVPGAGSPKTGASTQAASAKSVTTAKAVTGKPQETNKDGKSKESKVAAKPIAKVSAAKPSGAKPAEKGEPTRGDKKPADKKTSDKKPADKKTEDKKTGDKKTSGKQDKSKTEKLKPKSETGKSDKSKVEKGKSEKTKPVQGKPTASKSDKHKPIKKEEKGSGKVNKGPVKGHHGSVGSNLTKKKPR